MYYTTITDHKSGFVDINLWRVTDNKEEALFECIYKGIEILKIHYWNGTIYKEDGTPFVKIRFLGSDKFEVQKVRFKKMAIPEDEF